MQAVYSTWFAECVLLGAAYTRPNCAMLLLLLVIDMNQLTAVTSRRRRHVTQIYQHET